MIPRNQGGPCDYLAQSLLVGDLSVTIWVCVGSSKPGSEESELTSSISCHFCPICLLLLKSRIFKIYFEIDYKS